MRNATQSDRYTPGANDNKDQLLKHVVLFAALAMSAPGCFWRARGEPRHEERYEARPAERREERREERHEERRPEHREEHRD
jgi:hypothetical protein